MSAGAFVVIFMGIIVALAMFTPIMDTTSQMTTKQVADNESVSVVAANIDADDVNETIEFTIYSQSAWKQVDCPLTSVAIRNGAGTALTAVTDYVIDEDAGTFTLVNTTKTVPATSLNLTYVDYTYCADGYNKDTGSRNILNIVLIFAALTIMAFAYNPVREALANMGIGE